MNLTLYPTNFALCLCAYYLYTGEGAQDPVAKKMLGVF